MLKNILLSTMLAFGLFSCSNPASDDDHDEHARGIGIALVSSGQTIATYENEDPVTGQISVTAGTMTAGIDFMLIDEDGDRYTPDDETHALHFEFADTSVAGIWQHEGEEGGFEFHVQGKSVGSTTLTFTIYHDDHPDFVSVPVPVEVTE